MLFLLGPAVSIGYFRRGQGFFGSLFLLCALMGILIFQLGLGGLLVLGDMQGLRLPGFGPDAPRLTEPVRPGDQRRTFRPDRDRPVVQPARDPGELPDRLVLTATEGTTYRLEGEIRDGDAPRLIALL